MNWLSTLPHCALYGKPLMAGLLVFGNIGTWIAYMAIPIAIEIVRRKRGIPFNYLAGMFAAFILLCGLGHFLDSWAMLTGSPLAYWLEGFNSAATALVSLVTAFYCFHLMPGFLSYPTAHEWKLMKVRLKIYEDRERNRHGLPEPEKQHA